MLEGKEVREKIKKENGKTERTMWTYKMEF